MYASRIPISEMTMEDFAYYYPDVALDAINKPTYWPHDDESQPGPDDEKEASHGHQFGSSQHQQINYLLSQICNLLLHNFLFDLNKTVTLFENFYF